MRRLIPYALLTLVLDQASKLWILNGLNMSVGGDRIEVWPPPFLVFQMAWNYGINFGLFEGGSRWLLIGVALAICVWVLLWVRRGGMNAAGGQVFAGLLIGGALGNVVDRVAYGAVADFLNMSCCGIDNPFSFNIADVFIFVGAFGLILFAKDKNAA